MESTTSVDGGGGSGTGIVVVDGRGWVADAVEVDRRGKGEFLCALGCGEGVGVRLRSLSTFARTFFMAFFTNDILKNGSR